MRPKRKSKKKNEAVTDNDPQNRKSEIWVYVIIALFALFGLVVGYFMYQEFAGLELREDGHYYKIENEE